MNIYPIHLRKKRVETKCDEYYTNQQLKLIRQFDDLIERLDELKLHISLMDRKYGNQKNKASE